MASFNTGEEEDISFEGQRFNWTTCVSSSKLGNSHCSNCDLWLRPLIAVLDCSFSRCGGKRLSIFNGQLNLEKPHFIKPFGLAGIIVNALYVMSAAHWWAAACFQAEHSLPSGKGSHSEPSQDQLFLSQVSIARICPIFSSAIPRSTCFRWFSGFLCYPMDTIHASSFQFIFRILTLAKMHQWSRYLEIQNVFWPKEFNFETNFNDIALVKLSSPFKWSPSVKPACLPTSDLVREYKGPLTVSARGSRWRWSSSGLLFFVSWFENEFNLNSEIVQITGWGITEPPIFNKNDKIINHPKLPRRLKLAYVRDRTQENVCPSDKIQKICVNNGTLVLNSDFCQVFRRF